jgi:hypothetical protein
MNRPTKQRPQIEIAILPNGLYRAVATNGHGSAACTSGRPSSAITGALIDLRMDYASTATSATVTRARMHSDDVGQWIGRTVSVVGSN